MTPDERARVLLAIDGGRVIYDAGLAWAREQPVSVYPWPEPWVFLIKRYRDAHERIFVAVLAAIEAAGLVEVDRERLARMEVIETALKVCAASDMCECMAVAPGSSFGLAEAWADKAAAMAALRAALKPFTKERAGDDE